VEFVLVKFIKNKFKTEENRRLFSNYISLSVLQGANYILPLITFPYLVRVLGAEKFGLLAFATATIAYFQIITDYGFNLSATREVSIHRDNKEKLIEIFSAVMSIKIILMFLSLLLMSILVFCFERFSKDWQVYYLTFGMVLGQVLFPVWFFQGMEKMKYITFLNITAKLIFTAAIFIFVHEESDYYLVPICTSMGFIIAGILSIVFVRKHFGIRFKIQTVSLMKKYLKDGWYIFTSRIYVSLYTTTNTILLGLLTSNTIVGYYAIAEKIIMAIGGLFEPVNQALYPYLVKKFNDNKINFVKQIQKISKLLLFGSSLLALFLFLLKEEMIVLITGDINQYVLAILTILTLRIVVSPFGSFFTNNLITMGRTKEFNRVLRYTCLIDLVIVPVGICFYDAKGLAFAQVFVSLFVVIALFLNLKKFLNSKDVTSSPVFS